MSKRGGLKRIADRLTNNVSKALFAGGEAIAVEAQLSITRGAVSGKNHVPSRPGEPPKNDSGVLASNVETTQTAPLKVEVSSNAPYSLSLEYGTSRMLARPFMRPAADAKRKEVTKLVRDAVNHSIKQEGS